jgi:hypothetical protein
MKTKNIVKPATYDGKGPWLDYKSHFDVMASLRLMGLACFILSRMSPSINESMNCSLAKVSRTSLGASSKVTGTIERRHDGHDHVESRKAKNIVKPATYDGKGPWLDYKSHVDACSG